MPATARIETHPQLQGGAPDLYVAAKRALEFLSRDPYSILMATGMDPTEALAGLEQAVRKVEGR